MSIKVIKAGIFDTIQDNGRHGFSKWGINPGGSMDLFASQATNAVLGNDLGEAVIECHFPSSTFLFERSAIICIAGADFTPTIGDYRLPLWTPVRVTQGSVLKFASRQNGARAYLALKGGLQIAQWLNSKSTNVKAAAGGWKGRPLKQGDEIPFNTKKIFDRHALHFFPWRVRVDHIYAAPDVLSFITGPHFHWLSNESQQWLNGESDLEIDLASDRMAYRLKHAPLTYTNREELLSSGVAFGTIQGLPSGLTAMLMADHQTTGGYPNLGQVATADLPKLAQMSPTNRFRLRSISVEEAENKLLSLYDDLHMIADAAKKNWVKYEDFR